MNKKILFFIISWFGLSGIIAFSVTASAFLSAKIETDYKNLLETASNIATSEIELVLSLDGKFDSLSEKVNELEFTENDYFLELYSEKRSQNQIERTYIPPEHNLEILRQQGSDALKNLRNITVIFCITGIVSAFLITWRFVIKTPSS